MPENPYQPPLSPPWTPPVQERRGISILAIFLGVLTDVGGTMVLSIVLGVGFTVYLLSAGIAEEDLADEMRSPVFLLIGIIPGMGLTVLGGYVAGRVAKRSELLHGAISGSISAIVAALVQIAQSTSLWHAIAATAIVAPLAILGARFAMIRRRRQQIATETL